MTPLHCLPSFPNPHSVESTLKLNDLHVKPCFLENPNSGQSSSCRPPPAVRTRGTLGGPCGRSVAGKLEGSWMSYRSPTVIRRVLSGDARGLPCALAWDPVAAEHLLLLPSPVQLSAPSASLMGLSAGPFSDH